MRRFSAFAVIGHQPAINCWCIMSESEREKVEAAVIAQKMAASAKVCKLAEEQKAEAAKMGAEPSIQLKKARIDMNSIVKWKKGGDG